MMKKSTKASFVMGVALASFNASAGLIDFEGFAAGTLIDDEYSSLGVGIYGYNSNQSFGNAAVVFDTDNYTGGDDDLASPFTNDSGVVSNPGNILILHEHENECGQDSCGSDPDDEGSRPAGYFEITFDQAVILNSIDFFDVEEPESIGTVIEFYDVNDVAFNVGQYFTPDTGGDNKWARSVYDIEGVSRLRINLGGSGGIDNISYSVSVPEPGVLSLLLVGVSGLMLSRRKHRQY